MVARALYAVLDEGEVLMESGAASMGGRWRRRRRGTLKTKWERVANQRGRAAVSKRRCSRRGETCDSRGACWRLSAASPLTKPKAKSLGRSNGFRYSSVTRIASVSACAAAWTQLSARAAAHEPKGEVKLDAVTRSRISSAALGRSCRLQFAWAWEWGFQVLGSNVWCAASCIGVVTGVVCCRICRLAAGLR
eukprot:3085989-Rhodomonas_salina.3